MPRGTKIATANTVNVGKDCEPFKVIQSEAELEKSDIQISAQQLDEFAIDYGSRINPELSSTQRVELLQLLYKYRACFARNLKKMRRVKNYELEFTLKDRKPSFQRQYKLSQADALDCHRQITEMTKSGIIEQIRCIKVQFLRFANRLASEEL
jgi:hypothetical protein